MEIKMRVRYSDKTQMPKARERMMPMSREPRRVVDLVLTIIFA